MRVADATRIIFQSISKDLLSLKEEGKRCLAGTGLPLVCAITVVAASAHSASIWESMDASAGTIEVLEAGEEFKDVPWKAAVEK